MLVGSGAYIFKILDINAGRQINDFIYKISMPVMLFYFMAQTDVSEMNYDFIWLTVVYCFIVIGIATLVNHKFFTNTNKETAVATLAITFSNSAYIGLPLAFFAFGTKGMPPAVIISVIYMILFVSSALIMAEVDELKQSQKNKLLFVWNVIKNVMLAPMIFMSFLGIGFAFLQLELPQFLDSSLSLIANANIGIALIVIGMTLTRFFMNGEITFDKQFKKELAWANIFKLILCPFIAFLIIYPFDIDVVWKSVFIIQASLSTGLVSYIVSSSMQTYERRTAVIIFTSTILLIVTLSVILAMLFNWQA